MFIIKGKGPFADAVRRALEHAQSRGLDLSGVEVEVVPDPSITDFGAYAEHRGGLKFRIRYNPRYANDPVLAAHEAGHVAYWAWATKTGRTLFFNNPDVIEPLAEAFGAVVARQLYDERVTFKGAPQNLTQVLPQRTTYITATVGGKPIAVKVPEWGDYKSRYRAGILLSPYFYNMTNWAHVFGNFTAAPANVIETVHKAWRSGAVEVVPGWGAVWRREPTWSWLDTSVQDASSGASPEKTPDVTRQKPANTPLANTLAATTATQGGDAAQKNGANTDGNTPPQADARKAVVNAQPSADVPLPPSNVQPTRYFSSDIAPNPTPPEWNRYISDRRVLVVFRNWPSLDTSTLKETRKDHVAGVGVVSEGRLRFERRIPVPRVVDPDAWIEIVDEKTGKVLTRLRSDELYKLTNEGAPITLYWAHVAVEEKWPGWGRFIDRAKELDRKLGMWHPHSDARNWQNTQTAEVQPSGNWQTDVVVKGGGIGTIISTIRVANAPTEYVPPEAPDSVRKRFNELLSELKKLGEEVNLRNVDEVHNEFLRLRNTVWDFALKYPQFIDEALKVIGEVGSKIGETNNRLYGAFSKAAGGAGISLYKYDPATGAFTLYLRTGENVVGYVREDGTPVVVFRGRGFSDVVDRLYELIQKDPQNVPIPQTVKEAYRITRTKPQSPVDRAIREATEADRVLMSWEKYDPDTGAFMVLAYPSRDSEFLSSGYYIGYLKDDGTAVIVKKVDLVLDAKEEYKRLVESLKSRQDSSNQTSVEQQTTTVQQFGGSRQVELPQQFGGSRQVELPSPLNDLTKVPVVGPVLQTAKLLSQTPSAQSNQQTDFLQPLHSTLPKVPVVGPVLQTARLLLQTSGDSKTGADSHSERTPVVQTQPTSTQSTTQSSRQGDFLWPVHRPVYRAVDFLADAFKAGAGIKLAAIGVTALGGAKPTPADGSKSVQSDNQQPTATAPRPASEENRDVYNRRRGMPKSDSPPGSNQLGGGAEFIKPPSGQQRRDEFVAAKPSRPPDYVLAEEEARRSLARPPDYVFIETKGSSSAKPSGQTDRVLAGEAAIRRAEMHGTASNAVLQASSGYRPVDYIVGSPSGTAKSASPPSSSSGSPTVGSSGYRPVDYVVLQSSSSPPPSSVSPPNAQPAGTSQTQEPSSKRYRGKPVAVAI